MALTGSPRVVISGIGVVSPYGVGRECFWSQISRGRSATRQSSNSTPRRFLHGRRAGAGADDRRRDRSSKRARRAMERDGGHSDPRRYSRASLIGVIAASEAWHDAGLSAERAGRRRARRQRRGRHRRRRAAVRRILHRRLEAGHAVRHSGVDRRHDLERDFDRARAARHQPRALHRLHQLDRRDRLRRVADPRGRGRRHPVRRRRRLRHARNDLRLLADARGRHAYNDTPAEASRPFDRGRDGFVLGEGAWMVVLEREDRARARGARIYATVDGYGSTCDAYHRVQMDPDGEQIVRAMRLAIERSGRRARGDRLRELPRHLDGAQRRRRVALRAPRCSARAPTRSRARRPSR